MSTLPPGRPLPSLTFLGHSTMPIEIAATRILTDPLVFERLLMLRRTTTRLDPAVRTLRAKPPRPPRLPTLPGTRRRS